MRRIGFTLGMLCMSCLVGMAQGLFATCAHIDKGSTLDMVMGECFVEFTPSADMGFIPSMYYATISSELQLIDAAAIQVHFDNMLQQATIFLSNEYAQLQPPFAICGMDGNVYIEGRITKAPYFIKYAQLPAGVYILHIYDIPKRIPFTTRWIKK